EAGHAIDNAFHLRRRRARRDLFGRSSEPYPESYTPKPYSKNFVLHLDSWYAQSHPDEDFAETFAVWLTPDAEWRQRYHDWPAVKKLKYMDELMRSVAGKTPALTSGGTLDPLPSLKKTLRQHYRRKRRHYGIDYPSFYHRALARLYASVHAQFVRWRSPRAVSGRAGLAHAHTGRAVPPAHPKADTQAGE